MRWVHANGTGTWMAGKRLDESVATTSIRIWLIEPRRGQHARSTLKVRQELHFSSQCGFLQGYRTDKKPPRATQTGHLVFLSFSQLSLSLSGMTRPRFRLLSSSKTPPNHHHPYGSPVDGSCLSLSAWRSLRLRPEHPHVWSRATLRV